METRSLSHLAVKGVTWSAISAIGTSISLMIISIILARILSPVEFGLVNIAIVITGLFSILGDLGLSAGIIQRKNISIELLSSSFWVNVIIGSVLWILLVLLSKSFAFFFHQPSLQMIIVVSGLTLSINSFGIVHRAMLTRDLRFQELAFIDIFAVFVSGLIGIIAALRGFGAMSIAIQEVIRSILRTITIWVVNRWRPIWIFNWFDFKSIFNFSANVMASSFLNYIISNFDNLVVAKLFGAAEIGYYTIAYSLATLPQLKIAPLITTVAFPLFSKVQDDNDRFKRGYINSVFYISLIAFPLLFGLFTLAPEFITVVYGDKWSPVIVPLKILCIAGLFYSVSTTVGTVVLAKGRSEIMLFINIIRFILLSTFIIAGAAWKGINGVAGSISAYGFIGFLLYLWAVYRASNITPLEIAHAIRWPVISSLIMIAIISSYRLLWQIQIGHLGLIFLISAIFLGVITYFTTTWLTNQKLVRSTITLFRAQLNSF